MNETKKDLLVANLKVCMYEGTATAETFENVIKSNGLTCEIISLIQQYFKGDFDDSEYILKGLN